MPGRVILLCVVSLMGLTMACQAGQGGARYAHGERQVVSRGDISDAGGTLTISAPGSDINGLTVEVPPGAVRQNSTFVLKTDSGRLENALGTLLGPALTIEAQGVQSFHFPLKICVPIPREVEVHGLVGYAVKDDGRLSALTRSTTECKGHLAGFETYRPLSLILIGHD